MDLANQGKTDSSQNFKEGGTANYVRVKFLDGKEILGTLTQMNPQRPTFFITLGAPSNPAAPREVGFTAVKTVSFIARIQGNRNAIGFSRSARLVTVRFLDQDTLRGVVENYGGSRKGFFLVPTAQPDVERVYIPVTSIRDVISVKRLGEIMTEEGMATPEMVERAVVRQEQLRREPIGEILLKQKVINPQQLEDALRLQRQTGRRLGQILVDQRVVDPTQIEAALALQQRQRSMRIGQICAEMGCPEDQVGRALAIQYNVPFVDLAQQEVDASLRRVVPEMMARRHSIMPVQLQENVLTIAVADPVDHPAKDELRKQTGFTVVESVATPQAIGRAINRFYLK